MSKEKKEVKGKIEDDVVEAIAGGFLAKLKKNKVVVSILTAIGIAIAWFLMYEPEEPKIEVPTVEDVVIDDEAEPLDSSEIYILDSIVSN